MPTLLLLPGMDGTAGLRSDFVAALAPAVKAKVVTYPPDRPMGYAALELLARAEIPQLPFVLVGESFSGPIAISLAASNPPGLRGLVLVGSFARPPTALPRLLAWAATIIPVSWLPARFSIALLLGRNASPTLGERLISAIGAISPPVWRTRLRAVLFADVVADLPQIAVPILYLRAADDRIVPRSAYHVVARANPGTRLVELEGPHFMLLAKPAECATLVKDFMREVGFAF